LGCFEIKIIPDSNAAAENNASMSPQVIPCCMLELPLMRVAKKPARAIVV
jgi:hypothetical protein